MVEIYKRKRENYIKGNMFLMVPNYKKKEIKLQIINQLAEKKNKSMQLLIIMRIHKERKNKFNGG
jgi:hypothetical protein